jgi:hypothetical protein
MGRTNDRRPKKPRGPACGSYVIFDRAYVRRPIEEQPAEREIRITSFSGSDAMRRLIALVLAGLLLLPQLASGQALIRAGIGLLVGGAVGAAGGFAMASDDCGSQFGCANKTDPAILLGLGAGVVGGMLGLLSGAIPSERWERVSVEQRRVSFVAPSKGNGQGVGLRIAF